MIINIWKPIIKRVSKKITVGYELIKDISECKNGYKISFKCDYCDDFRIHNSFSNGILSGNKWNNVRNQMCRSCRSKKTEEEVKMSSVDWSIISNTFTESGYTLLTTENEYLKSNYRSHMKISTVCPNNHKYTCTWNNWSKGKRCRSCYDEYRTKNAIKNKSEGDLYYYLVNNITKRNYRRYKSLINPNNLERGHTKYQLDHKFSISEGFLNGIPPEIIGSFCNLEVIPYRSNNKKGRKCSITKEELYSLYENLITF